LGHQFLRHIERTRVLLLMVPVDSVDPQAEYDRLRVELAMYPGELTAIPFLVALTKVDLLGPEEPLPDLDVEGALGAHAVSTVVRRGVPELLEALWDASRAVISQERDGDDGDEWQTP